MAKFELKFIDCYSSESFIKTNVGDELEHIVIELFDSENNNSEGMIFLDKSTAIKFAKTLRTEINKITESEALNG